MAYPHPPEPPYRPSPPPPGVEEVPRPSFFRDVGRLARATGALARDHLVLAQVEMKREGKRLAMHSVVLLAAIPFLLTSLIMMSVALAIGLSRWVGGGWASLIVAGLLLAIGGVLAAYGGLKLKEERSRMLRHTKAELRKDRRTASNVVERAKVPTASLHRERPGARLGNGAVHPD